MNPFKILLNTTGILVLLIEQNFADQSNFDANVYETWTSSAGTSIEARLANLTEEGHCVFETKEGKQIIVPNDQLSKQSQERASLLTSKKPDPAEKADNSEVSFFGIPIDPTTSSSDPEHEAPNVENHSLVGTQWSGLSPIRKSKFKNIKVTFETANRLRWSQCNGDYHMKYKLVGNQFQVERKAPLIFKKLENGYLSVSVKTKGKPQINMFSQVDPK